MPVQEGFRMLYGSAAIQDRVGEHVDTILAYCARRKITTLYLVVCLVGAMPYAMDLARGLSRFRRGLGQVWEPISISRYGDATIGGGEFTTKIDVPADLAGKDVLVVEDIVDEGYTLAEVLRRLKQVGPRSVAITAITEKVGAQKVPLPDRLTQPLPIRPNSDGTYPWIEGYGLDTAKEYRQLDHIRYRILR